ncbi:hypothetical protein J2X72_003818 [Phyllobacterium sp. 1468]|nr:hypothetical protein [Phyllobacterium sp. 1468]
MLCFEDTNAFRAIACMLPVLGLSLNKRTSECSKAPLNTLKAKIRDSARVTVVAG